VLILLGLGTSLTIKRRRFWAKIGPADSPADRGRTVMEIGGLARTDQAGYGEEFGRLRTALLGTAAGDTATVGADTATGSGADESENTNTSRPDDGPRDRGGSA
jgi:cytochrome c biogenesis protein